MGIFRWSSEENMLLVKGLAHMAAQRHQREQIMKGTESHWHSVEGGGSRWGQRSKLASCPEGSCEPKWRTWDEFWAYYGVIWSTFQFGRRNMVTMNWMEETLEKEGLLRKCLVGLTCPWNPFVRHCVNRWVPAYGWWCCLVTFTRTFQGNTTEGRANTQCVTKCVINSDILCLLWL